MARRGSTRKGSGIVSRLWSPFNHLFQATGNSAQGVGSAAGKIVKSSIGAVAGVGRSFARHSNMAISNLTRRGRRGRRGTRRNSRR
jgi:hypothetical protein